MDKPKLGNGNYHNIGISEEYLDGLLDVHSNKLTSVIQNTADVYFADKKITGIDRVALLYAAVKVVVYCVEAKFDPEVLEKIDHLVEREARRILGEQYG